MVQLHRWSVTEIENMLPWERDIYVDKLIQHVKEQNAKVKSTITLSGMNDFF